MKINILVFDEQAMGTLGNAILEDSWFSEFPLPPGIDQIKRVQISDTLYIISVHATENSNLLVIRVGEKGIFSAAPSPRHTFDRILHIALAQFETTVSIPITWKPYNDDSRLSVYAQSASQGGSQRLYVDRNPLGTKNVYAYALTSDVIDFGKVPYDAELFRRAYNGYVDALLMSPPPPPRDGAYGIVLTEPLGNILLGHATLDEWYDRILTRQQREFVDRDHSAPVRLKGQAGTGKTLSLSIKCLRDTYRFDSKKKPLRVAFLTHSSALAHDVVLSMFHALDPQERWKSMRHGKIWLGSLYELAQEFLEYERKDLTPLSTDGREGREFQYVLISDAIDRCISDTNSALSDLARRNPDFASGLKSENHRDQFIAELMNEFACVIDAEGIRKGNPASEKYLVVSRESWQMDLPGELERRAVLDVHEAYCSELERSNVLSMDQMVADFNRYLLTHEWRQLRDRNGFDAIFVDELHYFNRAERMVFHNLFKNNALIRGKHPLFMAYDLKQSSTDALLNYSSHETPTSIFRNIGAGSSELVELTEVFRSTPQIADFLKDLDGSFPALGLEEEWGNYPAESRQDSGASPTLRTYSRNAELIDDVFRRAQRESRRQGGRQVAVLCVNDRLFGQYLEAGRIRGKYLEISARDQINELKYAGKRCVFSMPEYVAGLQFRTVFLIHLDKAEIDSSDGNIGVRRRFISRCYLGASRAATHLHIASSNERGGPAHILEASLKSGSLRPLHKA